MRASFPWIPVYTTLYFESDPGWLIPKEFETNVERALLYPSAYYEDLLRDARIHVIAPPLKLRPVSADSLSGILSQLERELDSASPSYDFQAAGWGLAKQGIKKARRLSKASA